MDNGSRRKFLGICLGGVVTTAVGAVVYPLYRYLSPRSAVDNGAKVAIPESELPEGGAKFFQFAGSTAVVVRTRDHGVVAYSAVCTHLGCVVQWEKEKQDFLCPCHGGRYAIDGKVKSGPPPRPLGSLPVKVAEGIITVG